MIMFDFIQGVLCGFIKCLNLQKLAIGVNFVTYYIIISPVAYFLGFVYRFGSDAGEKGCGLKGLWYAILIGQIHQIIVYFWLINRTDWQEVIEVAKERVKVEDEI